MDVELRPAAGSDAVAAVREAMARVTLERGEVSAAYASRWRCAGLAGGVTRRPLRYTLSPRSNRGAARA